MAAVQLLKLLKKLNIINEIPEDSVFVGKECGAIHALGQLGLLNQNDALTKIADFLKIKVIDLEAPDAFDPFEAGRAMEKIDPALLWKHTVLPLFEEDRNLTIAVADPFNHDVQQLLQFATGKPLTVMLALEEQIVRCLNRLASRQAMPFDELEEVVVPDNVEVISGIQEEADVGGAGPETPPIIRLSHKILADAIDNKASDIHLEPSQESLSVRLRIDGVMHLLFELPKKIQPHIISRFKLLAGMDISERRRPQDGRFTVRYGRHPVDIRSSTVPTPFGEKIVLRVLVSDITKLSFSQMGAAASLQQELLRVLSKKGKMLLVTGPTGSGKTTTLYTCLNYMRDGTHNIVTVEDPIEYRIPGINQIQVNEAIGMSFAKTLRSVLRQDPDIILIGEIRDSETARIAFQAAQTGHLVLSTLHTNDAPSALSRLLGLSVEEYTLASSLEGILAQRLVRKICTHCSVAPSEEWLAKYGEYIEAYALNPATLRVGKGCEHCRGVGLSGQMGIFSYLHISEGVAEKIRLKVTAGEVLQQAQHDGFRSIEEEALALIKEGLTSIEEAKGYLEGGDILSQWRDSKRVSGHQMENPSVAKRDTREVSVSDATQLASYEKPRILLIEDDTDMRDILSLVLQKEMYDVIEASNGREGLELLFEKKPSLILCDLMMPNMDGREFLKRVRANPGARMLPVIILTAVDSEDNEVDLLDLGATDFVSKTDSTNIMLSRVRNALSGD